MGQGDQGHFLDSTKQPRLSSRQSLCDLSRTPKRQSLLRSRVTVANWNPGEYGVARVVKQRIRRHTGGDKSKVSYSVEHDSVNVD